MQCCSSDKSTIHPELQWRFRTGNNARIALKNLDRMSVEMN